MRVLEHSNAIFCRQVFFREKKNSSLILTLIEDLPFALSKSSPSKLLTILNSNTRGEVHRYDCMFYDAGKINKKILKSTVRNSRKIKN